MLGLGFIITIFVKQRLQVVIMVLIVNCWFVISECCSGWYLLQEVLCSFRKAEGVDAARWCWSTCIFEQINVILTEAFLLFFESFSPSYILHCFFSRPFCIYSPLCLSLFVFCTWVSVHSEGQVDPVSNQPSISLSSAFHPSLYPLSFFFLFSRLLCSADGQPLLLPPGQVQELHSTATLNAVQRLFSHHLIQTFGCDYSTSLSLDTLQAKLRSFLELCTAEGPRHDTYILYYSGHTLPSGDWTLAGKSWIAIDWAELI